MGSENLRFWHFDILMVRYYWFSKTLPGFQISTPGQNLSLSISETSSGDTQTQADTLKQVFNDLSDVMFVVWFYGGK
jgi:hypothetical protein